MIMYQQKLQKSVGIQNHISIRFLGKEIMKISNLKNLANKPGKTEDKNRYKNPTKCCYKTKQKF